VSRASYTTLRYLLFEATYLLLVLYIENVFEWQQVMVIQTK